ncbi:sugar transferase [[Clostridium] symbiosum]|jgi:undecaprenyl phosphate N,N'-diacetylbacillosamine 1-phosphate transferase|uniref:sugar transferase n=1 Tax=Clostridium symbiosum TaxID=1512 RepID=UPI000E50ED5A|nr:sugar transferase [[Clostridium] symbiosum]MDB2010740.1 sugar transferase [[Clostridium] symbiosum]MDB2028219.1 sugar transferase [[Clostridium] symbiosum]RHB60544.1 sugar transferase [[Clostridium] symbiosum]
MYRKYIKRLLDIIMAAAGIIVLSPVMLVTAFLVRVKLGSPVIFKQKRPGKNERIFEMYKFRSMTDERDQDGNLLPDEVRLTEFGKKLRATSLDELPELFNILKGDMSVVGPRPQLVRDMVFMSKRQRCRHLVKPGLSGLAQVNGRNAITWETKLELDLQYIKKITFLGDANIIFQTVIKAFIKRDGITEDDRVTAEDFGDYLLRTRKVNKDKYDKLQNRANNILHNRMR